MSIVEKMARAIYEAGGFDYASRTVFPAGGTPYGQWAVAVEQARAALAAASLTESQLEGLANGTMACVPVEPTEAMLLRGARAKDDFMSQPGPYANTKAIYRAMLAAKEG